MRPGEGDGNWDCNAHEAEGEDETHGGEMWEKQGGMIDGDGNLVFKLHFVCFSFAFSCPSGYSVLGLSPGGTGQVEI